MQHQQIIHTQSQNTGPINFNETFADYELLEKKVNKLLYLRVISHRCEILVRTVHEMFT